MRARPRRLRFRGPVPSLLPPRRGYIGAAAEGRCGFPVPGAIPQALVTDSPGSSRISPSPVRKAFDGARHRLDGQAAPRDVGKRVAAEDHQVAVRLVGPEREPAARRGIVQLDPDEAVLAPVEVGVGAVEHRRADRPRGAEVVRGAVDGSPLDREGALVGEDHGSRGHAEHDGVDRRCADGEVRVGARPVGARLGARRSSRSSAPGAPLPTMRTRPRARACTDSPAADGARAARSRGRARPPVPPTPPSGRARGSRSRARPRSAGADSGAPRTRSFRPRSGSATGSGAGRGRSCTRRRRGSRR